MAEALCFKFEILINIKRYLVEKFQSHYKIVCFFGLAFVNNIFHPSIIKYDISEQRPPFAVV